MEEYKERLVNEICSLKTRIERLEKFIKTHGSSTGFDPIQLSLMKVQIEHMKNYFTVLFMRCQLAFDMDEFEELMKKLEYDTVKDKAAV